jgi:hypothetical protein
MKQILPVMAGNGNGVSQEVRGLGEYFPSCGNAGIRVCPPAGQAAWQGAI